jgi:hypothetical protein
LAVLSKLNFEIKKFKFYLTLNNGACYLLPAACLPSEALRVSCFFSEGRSTEAGRSLLLAMLGGQAISLFFFLKI